MDFKTQNVSEFNLNLAESALAQRQREASVKKLQYQQFITGEPYYQVYKNFDYWLKFNNQNAMEERNVKLLLCLPLIPERHHRDIKLVSKQFTIHYSRLRFLNISAKCWILDPN